MRNKFGYWYSIKICASRYNEFLESIFGILLAVEAFSQQKVVEMLEQVVAGWVNMAGEAKLHSPILSSFETLVVWPAVRCGCAEQSGPFCWLVQATGVAVFDASHQFAEHTSQMLWFHWDSESYRGSDGQQTTKQWPWPFFGHGFLWLWEVLWSFFSVQPLSWSSLVVTSLVTVCNNPIKNCSLLLHK